VKHGRVLLNYALGITGNSVSWSSNTPNCPSPPKKEKQKQKKHKMNAGGKKTLFDMCLDLDI